jgi:hypothetical protein
VILIWPKLVCNGHHKIKFTTAPSKKWDASISTDLAEVMLGKFVRKTRRVRR